MCSSDLGAGANIAVQLGDDGVLLVDTGFVEMSDKVINAVRNLSDEPIRTIINTTLADDHTGANGPLVAAGFLNQAGPGLGGRPNEADLINSEGFRVRMPVRGRKDQILIDSRELPGKVTAGGTTSADPKDFDLIGLAMQEPQYRSPGVQIGRAHV